MGRVAIVTGGTRGIGEAISIALREMGIDSLITNVPTLALKTLAV